MWHDNPQTSFPPAFSGSSLTLRPIFHDDLKYVTWKNKKMSIRNYDILKNEWELAYPKISYEDQNGKPRTKHETTSYRNSQTSKTSIRKHCWDKLPFAKNIPSSLRHQFKVDAYGNVISLNAEHLSVCSWDVDHIFPWSRGGRSVNANFAAVQSNCNENVKNKYIHQSITDKALKVGLTLEQFQALAPLMLTGRKLREKQLKKDIIRWLTSRPCDTKRALSSFNKKCSSTNATEIITFFEQRDEEDRKINKMNRINALKNLNAVEDPVLDPLGDQTNIFVGKINITEEPGETKESHQQLSSGKKLTTIPSFHPTNKQKMASQILSQKKSIKVKTIRTAIQAAACADTLSKLKINELKRKKKKVTKLVVKTKLKKKKEEQKERKLHKSRCGVCTGCTANSCEKCKYCLDKKSNGGSGTKKKGCMERRCICTHEQQQTTKSSKSTSKLGDGASTDGKSESQVMNKNYTTEEVPHAKQCIAPSSPKTVLKSTRPSKSPSEGETYMAAVYADILKQPFEEETYLSELLSEVYVLVPTTMELSPMVTYTSSSSMVTLSTPTTATTGSIRSPKTKPHNARHKTDGIEFALRLTSKKL